MATKLLPAAWLLALALALPAQAAEFDQVVTSRSHIGFVFRQMGVPVSGSFRTFAAQVAFDPAKPQTARAQVEIELASIDAGSQEADDEAKSKNWFHIQQFPKAMFVSSGIKALGANRYQLAGRLTIKGKARDIVVPVMFKPDGANGILEGGFTLNRLDYGIGSGLWGDTDTVADEVQVTFRFLVAVTPPAKTT